jgi:signal transduction histidine kinase/DNA-binding response OmpR family regulator
MADAEKINILVVDDLPEKLLVYRSVLEELGENVITVNSGAEALKQVLRRDFAVILLDINMPGMDGLETAALIRKRKKSARTPIIFVTSYLDEFRTVQAYAHGAVDYILAPVEPEVLRAKVRVFVDLFRMHQQLKSWAEERIALAEERAKRAAAEEASRRSALLAEAGTVLTDPLDFEARLHGLVGLVIPFLADLSIVRLSGAEGQPGRTEWAWIDRVGGITTPPSDTTLAPSSRLADIMSHVLTTGKLELLERLDPPLPAVDAGERVGTNGPSHWLPDFKLTSALVLPLAARGKTVGTLALAFGRSGRAYGPGEQSLAEELADRAGIAIDNALLVRDIQEADRRKDEFLAMLGHELRNPLAPIRNAVQVMRLIGPSDPELQWSRDVIDRQLRHLTRLVDDLLDVSRITRGKIRLELAPLDVVAAVAAAVETSRPLIESRRHELTLSLPSQPLWVRADLARLAQVLSNLLNNAAKYTDEGGHIWLTVVREGDQAVFRVRDNGPGIPREMLRHIFDLFTQAEQSLDRAQGGLGIGLTLAQRLVELHHGSIEAYSEGPEQGSEFVVRLPAQAEGTVAETGGGPDKSLEPTFHRRVLVVDDNVDAAESLAILVRLDGHEVRTAHDGPTALEVAETFCPEIVLLDIGLPAMDGYEVGRRLRSQPKGSEMLLAAVTGYGQEEDRSHCQQAGFDEHLIKPVDPEALRRLLQRRGQGNGWRAGESVSAVPGSLSSAG